MKNPSDNWEEVRQKVLGLGDSSVRKTHYPNLRQRLVELERLRSELQRSEAYLSEAQRLSHTGSFGWSPLTGEISWSDETFRIFEYDPGVKPTLDLAFLRMHPDDRARVRQILEQASKEGTNCEYEQRLLMPDNRVKWLHIVAHPVRDSSGNFEFLGAVTDISERKCAEQERQAHVWFLESMDRINRAIQGNNDLEQMMSDVLDAVLSIFVCDRAWLVYPCDPESPSWRTVMERTRPEFPGAFVLGFDFPMQPEVAHVHHLVRGSSRAVRFGAGSDTPVPTGIAQRFSVQSQILMAVYPKNDKPYVFGLDQCTQARVWTREEEALFEAIGGRLTDTLTSVLMFRNLQESQARLEEAQRIAHVGYWARDLDADRMNWSDETYRIFGLQPQVRPIHFADLQEMIHPEDREMVIHAAEQAWASVPYNVEYRVIRPSGEVRIVHSQGSVTEHESGRLSRMFGTVQDITERKRAEEKLRQSEEELRQLVDAIPQQVFVFSSDWSPLFANRRELEYTGLTPQEVQSKDAVARVFHPEDFRKLQEARERALMHGKPIEIEARMRGTDGQYRWFLIRDTPLRDEQGRVLRWYGTRTDIEDRKQAEERLQHENVVLREEIDKASMFEEIVGASAALRVVLSRIAKVAPTDSTVLISGETGTGKELIARAIHKRSRRSSHAFVSVNCAATPRDLIASELFGHEKGSFTGATQRRLGRFELAEGGTIFLDEVGELPVETQIALLRVLQEREFERVGGNQAIRADVRVIAATNRDLQIAIAAGTFRDDLFYRLNVFPIEIPPLRERREDIPLLVEYFIDRYARKTGKSIRGIDRKTLDLLKSYPWPGNIRELQNIIERSVIVCDTENLSVDQSWLSQRPATPEPSQPDLSQRLAAQEREAIEAALSDCNGRVAGPLGASAKLGMPRSTLESKIRSLKINKNRFRNPGPFKKI